MRLRLLPWCDRIALSWGLFLFLILTAAWRGPYLWWDGTVPPLWEGAWEFGWWLVGIPWLALRLIDFVAGGPLRREPGPLKRLIIRALRRMQYNQAVNYGLIKPTLTVRQTPPAD